MAVPKGYCPVCEAAVFLANQLTCSDLCRRALEADRTRLEQLRWELENPVPEDDREEALKARYIAHRKGIPDYSQLDNFE